MAMKAKYQKYLDALKGADFSSAQSQFTSGVSGAKNNMKSMQTSLSSWQELASATVNNETLPMISGALDMLESNGEVLGEVNSKVKELVSSLEALESLENEKDSLGSKWSYTEGGSHTQSEVNSHNNKIDEVEKKITEQEGTIDGQIAAINGLSVGNVADCYISATTTETTSDTSTEDTSSATDTSTLTEPTISTATGPSGVLSYTVGDVPEAGKQVNSLGKKAVLLDVQVDGNSLGQDGSIVIKKGETVHLKVKVPDEIDNVQTLKRTSADGKRGWSNWVSQKNYPQVNKKDTSTYVNAREYDWYITGTKTTDNITLSQTALFSIPGAKYGSYKGMVRVRVKIVDGGTSSSDDKDDKDDKKDEKKS